MTYRYKKVGKGKKILIRTLYRVGIRVANIVKLSGFSRATIYRHINK